MQRKSVEEEEEGVTAAQRKIRREKYKQ